MSENVKASITVGGTVLGLLLSLLGSVWISSSAATAVRKDVDAATAANKDQEERLRRVEAAVIRTDENLLWLRQELVKGGK